MFEHRKQRRGLTDTLVHSRRRSGCAPAESLESRTYLTGISFTGPTTFPIAGANLSTPPAIADFNHDGIPDIAVAINIAGSQNTVAVLLGTGKGTFTADTTLTGGRRGSQVVAGDFNGDGNMDIAVTNGQDGTISVFTGNGAGVFSAPIDSTYGTSDNAGTFADLATLATADLNGDNKPDLIVGDGNDNLLITMLGHGDGTFSISQEQTATAPGPIVVADFNSDSKLDVATTLGTARGISLFLGNGNGTLKTPTAFTAATPLDFGTGNGLATADVNGDGQPDLLVVSNRSTVAGPGTLSVLLGDGSGGFRPSKDFTVLNDANSVAVGDFNLDGKQDVLVSSLQTGFEVFAGNGDGTFNSTPDLISPVGQDGAAAVADFNGDGKPDLAVSQVDQTADGSHGIGIFLNGPSPASVLVATLSGKLPTSAVAGENPKIIQTLTVTNTGGAFRGSVTGALFLSAGTTIDANSIALPTTFKKSLNVKANGHTNFHFRVTSIPATMPDGTYHLLAQITDPSANTSVAASTATITVTPPQIDLSGAFVKFPSVARIGKRSAAVISVTNNGTTAATGAMLPIVLQSSSTQSLSGASQIAALSRKINIKPGKTVRVRIPLAFASAGSFFLGVQLDPTNTLRDINVSNNTFFSLTPVIVS